MKLNRIIGILALGLALFGATDCHAAAAARAAKAVQTIAYSTTLSSVAVTGPAVVYSVTLSTGVAGTDFTSLWDAANIGSLTTNTTGTSFKARVNVSSATQNTVVVFDPPLQFNAGIIAGQSSSANWSAITFERGRVTQAQ